MALIVRSTIVEDGMSNPIFDRLDVQAHLMVILVVLITVCTTIGQSVNLLIVKITISIIQRHTRPLTTQVLINA